MNLEKSSLDNVHIQSYSLNTWYKMVEQITFETITIPLNHEDAMMICKYEDFCKTLFMNTSCPFEEDRSANDYSVIDQQVQEYLEMDGKEILSNLEKKLDKLIQPFVRTNGGAFIKLSSRSPKDAALISLKMEGILKNAIQNSTTTDSSSHESELEDLLFFTKACTDALKVVSGSEALWLLLHSKRVYQDIMIKNLLCSDVDPESCAKNFNLHLVIRAWCNDIAADYEFRMFVWGNTLTAVTQYSPYFANKGLYADRDKVRELLIHFWKDDVSMRLSEEWIKGCGGTYVVDVAVSTDLSKVWLIEVNPPPPTAGCALFDWKNEQDQKIIKNTKNETIQEPNISDTFELRIAAQVDKGTLNKIHPPLRRFINKQRGRKEEEPQLTKVFCDGCSEGPLPRGYYKCTQCCPSFDLCIFCFRKKDKMCPEHNPNHRFALNGIDIVEEKPKNFESTSWFGF